MSQSAFTLLVIALGMAIIGVLIAGGVHQDNAELLAKCSRAGGELVFRGDAPICIRRDALVELAP